MSGPGYGCALGDESHQVNWLLTRLRPASTLSFCDEDFAPGLIHVLATDLATDPERLYDVIKRHLDREAARQAKAAEGKARKTPWPVYNGAPASCICGAQPDEFNGLEHIGDGPHQPVEIEATP